MNNYVISATVSKFRRSYAYLYYIITVYYYRLMITGQLITALIILFNTNFNSVSKYPGWPKSQFTG